MAPVNLVLVLQKHTSIHCGVSGLWVVGVWYSIGWRIIANHKVDGGLKGNNWLVYQLIYFFEMEMAYIS